VLQTRTKQLIGRQLLGGRTACPHGRKLPETRTYEWSVKRAPVHEKKRAATERIAPAHSHRPCAAI
ncbi:hypothetical protein, partial [Xanthomonas oryzae]|uniref:hypothetical protein n=1 Tax=Xanthomonas oryzae TaxID=347 RepID=UPI001C0B7792